jgi:tetratricopeptide (TPR) repeat protein
MKPLRVFLAMPGTNFGPDASWQRADDIRSFFEKFRKALEDQRGQPVKLIVEREKRSAGVIHDSMFREAYEADVYIADLTGQNPNVFLELGVRYALRPNVTIPVSQSTNRHPFNVSHMRTVQYANRPDDVAIKQLIELVEAGLADRSRVDSPVLSVLDLVSLPREEWQRVSGARRDALLQAARESGDRVDKVRILREALEIDPHSSDVRAELLSTLRKQKSYTEAITVADDGIKIDPARAVFFQEKGISLDRLDDLEAAEHALRHAVRLEPTNVDILCSLGGVIRRMALARAPAVYDEARLLEAYDCYRRATGIARYNTYPALNMVRLEFLLSRFKSVKRSKTRLEGLYHLCSFKALENPDDYWALFDLADTELLLGRNAGQHTYKRAIGAVPVDERGGILLSPKQPLLELLDAKVLTQKVANLAQRVVANLDQAMEVSPK